MAECPESFEFAVHRRCLKCSQSVMPKGFVWYGLRSASSSHVWPINQIGIYKHTLVYTAYDTIHIRSTPSLPHKFLTTTIVVVGRDMLFSKEPLSLPPSTPPELQDLGWRLPLMKLIGSPKGHFRVISTVFSTGILRVITLSDWRST